MDNIKVILAFPSLPAEFLAGVTHYAARYEGSVAIENTQLTLRGPFPDAAHVVGTVGALAFLCDLRSFEVIQGSEDLEFVKQQSLSNSGELYDRAKEIIKEINMSNMKNIQSVCFILPYIPAPLYAHLNGLMVKHEGFLQIQGEEVIVNVPDGHPRNLITAVGALCYINGLDKFGVLNTDSDLVEYNPNEVRFTTGDLYTAAVEIAQQVEDQEVDEPPEVVLSADWANHLSDNPEFSHALLLLCEEEGYELVFNPVKNNVDFIFTLQGDDHGKDPLEQVLWYLVEAAGLSHDVFRVHVNGQLIDFTTEPELHHTQRNAMRDYANKLCWPQE